MSNNTKNNGPKDFQPGLAQALNNSDHELIHMANYYHQRGYVAYAQEIYRQIFTMRAKRNILQEKVTTEQRGEAS